MKKFKTLTDKELVEIKGGYAPVVTVPILISQKVASWVASKISN